MPKTRALMTAMIICAGLQFGCGADEDADSTKDLGPKEVALAMLRAMAAGDGSAAAAFYDCSVDDKEYLIKTMPFLKTVHTLVTAATKAYGDDVWTEASATAGIGMIIPDMENAEDTLQCEIIENKATFIMRGLPRALNLHKKDGRWLIIPHSSQLPSLSQRGEIIKTMLEVKVAIDAIIPKVGSSGVSASDICAEVKAAMKRK